MGLTFNPLNPLLSLLVQRNPLELDSKVGLFKPKKERAFALSLVIIPKFSFVLSFISSHTIKMFGFGTTF